jgi:hypothetical protein
MNIDTLSFIHKRTIFQEELRLFSSTKEKKKKGGNTSMFKLQNIE